MVAVPYRGGAPLVQDLLGGQVPAAFLSLTESIEHHRSGKMHVMAVSGTTRAKSAPDIPTFQELGIKGVDLHGFHCDFFLTPAPNPTCRTGRESGA
jgi:tripartite-type tricarboxylate transporter receptor subunit TctC